MQPLQLSLIVMFTMAFRTSLLGSIIPHQKSGCHQYNSRVSSLPIRSVPWPRGCCQGHYAGKTFQSLRANKTTATKPIAPTATPTRKGNQLQSIIAPRVYPNGWSAGSRGADNGRSGHTRSSPAGATSPAATEADDASAIAQPPPCPLPRSGRPQLG